MENKRFDKAQILVDMFRLYCSSHGLDYAESGIEIRKFTKQFMNKLREDSHDFMKIMRYFPDFVVYNKQKEVWLLELKNSLFIEKDAYESYCVLRQDGLNIGLVFLYKSAMQLVKLDDIVLKVPSFPDTPTEDVWCIPRLLDNEKYAIWKNQHSGSGTPFSVIDLELTRYTTLLNKVWDIDGNLWD